MILETGIDSKSRWVPACIFCLLALSAIAVEPLKPGNEDTIVVRADQAWEDSDKSITYYRGNFELSTPDWSVQAAEATVFGPLNNPERVLLNGEPARIWISQPEKSKIVEGSGTTIEYLLNTDLVTLSGGAELRDGEDTVTSESILYDIEKDSYRSGNSGRVKVSITPKEN